jgi:hypothetical protein
MTAAFDTSDAVRNAELLSRVEEYLSAKGFDAGRAKPIGSAGRVAGSMDGFFVDIHLPEHATQIVVEGSTPCVR